MHLCAQKSDAAQRYLAAVRDFEDYPVGITSDEEVFKDQEAKDGQVILFKQFDEGRAVYEGGITRDSLQEFIHRYAVPLVIEFNHETAQKIFKGLIKSHLLAFISKTAENYSSVWKGMHKLAGEMRDKLMFVVVDLDEDDNRRVIEFLGLKSEPMPNVRIIQMQENDIIKYKPEKPSLEEEDLAKFAKDFLDNKVPVHYLSEDLPEDWNEKPVKTLVGKNFDEVAFDKSKNVLVEFYAPWCGHCKQLAPIWDKLAEALADKEDVLVAKMDATTNELPHTRVRSFPTIKLYQKDTNEAHEYNGERTLEGIKKFLETNGEYGKAAPDHDEL
jgi:protein disulfide-isomerase A1